MSHDIDEAAELKDLPEIKMARGINSLDEKELEDLAFHAIKQMRKGFISAMILAILKDGELHGYGIMKEIKNKIQGLWTPLNSSIYPILKHLKGKRLVNLAEEKETSGKIRKIYKITPKGERFLKFFVRKFQLMMSRLRTLTMGAFGFDGNYPLEEHISIMRDHPIFGWENGKSEREKKENLKYYSDLLDERILDLKGLRNYINEELSGLHKGERNED